MDGQLRAPLAEHASGSCVELRRLKKIKYVFKFCFFLKNSTREGNMTFEDVTMALQIRGLQFGYENEKVYIRVAWKYDKEHGSTKWRLAKGGNKVNWGYATEVKGTRAAIKGTSKPLSMSLKIFETTNPQQEGNERHLKTLTWKLFFAHDTNGKKKTAKLSFKNNSDPGKSSTLTTTVSLTKCVSDQQATMTTSQSSLHDRHITTPLSYTQDSLQHFNSSSGLQNGNPSQLELFNSLSSIQSNVANEFKSAEFLIEKETLQHSISQIYSQIHSKNDLLKAKRNDVNGLCHRYEVVLREYDSARADMERQSYRMADTSQGNMERDKVMTYDISSLRTEVRRLREDQKLYNEGKQCNCCIS